MGSVDKFIDAFGHQTNLVVVIFCGYRHFAIMIWPHFG
ncbi:Uncharacterised protein [Vibrio cholerae]|nr:Uncharacterised protein [Vibrio cholerae]